MTFTPITRSILILFCLTGLLVSCEKGSSENTPTKEDIISGQTWKFSKATSSGTDISSLIQGCFKDNTLRFTKASPQNTGILNEGATLCNVGDPQERGFTWSYDASFQKLTVLGTTGTFTILPGGSNEFTIVRLSAAEMVLSQNVSFAGSTQLIEVTLVP